MADTVAQIKSRLNLSDVIGGYLKLQKAGANFKARCPFHNEKTPSFHINTERQIWHCFGCNKGGDLFSFLQDIEGIDFPEALRILAARAGVPLEPYRAGQSRESSRRAVLLRANEHAQAFFEKQLWHSDAGARALAYLRERGMTDETIQAWHIGWAPNDWRALAPFLQKKECAADDIVSAGLAVQKTKGSLYDRFRGRIMFPICDANGQAVGFAGRIFGRGEDTQEPKYINTPQTPLYDKGRILFGLHLAKMAIRDEDACVLVEGNTDAIMSWQAGVRNVVATSGTALTADQLRLLSRYSKNLDFCFDLDLAGAAATRRGIALALAQGAQVRIATLTDEQSDPSLPAGRQANGDEERGSTETSTSHVGSTGSSSEQYKDPADYVRLHGAQFRDVIAAAKPAVQHYLDESLRTYDPTSAASKRAIMASVGPFIREMPSRVEASHWIARLSSVLRVPEQDVRADLASLPRESFEVPTADESGSVPTSARDESSPPDPLEQAVLALLMSDLPSLHGALGELNHDWVGPAMRPILDDLASRKPEDIDWNRFIDEHTDGTWRLDFAHMRAQELLSVTTEGERKRQWRMAVARLGRRALERKAADLEMEIKAAEDAKDAQRMGTLLNDFSRLKRDIANLSRAT